MKYFVYLIVSTQVKHKNGISYVGYTNNIKKRLLLHNNSKGAKFTRGRLWKLAYSKGYQSKNIALKEEYMLKHNYKLRNKIKKNFLKMRTLFYQLMVQKIYPTKNKFKIASIFKG